MCATFEFASKSAANTLSFVAVAQTTLGSGVQVFPCLPGRLNIPLMRRFQSTCFMVFMCKTISTRWPSFVSIISLCFQDVGAAFLGHWSNCLTSWISSGNWYVKFIIHRYCITCYFRSQKYPIYSVKVTLNNNVYDILCMYYKYVTLISHLRIKGHINDINVWIWTKNNSSYSILYTAEK